MTPVMMRLPQRPLLRFVQDPAWLAFAVFAVLIVLLKWRSFLIPPVWDESVSIFPAADYLARHNFDLAGLLNQPDCGAHWLSLMSVLTAVVMGLAGTGATVWALLHLVQWLAGAATCVVLLRMLAPLLGERLAILSTLLFLVMPVTLAQLGFMYIEIVLTFFCLAAVYLYLARREGASIFLCLLACLTKETGILIAVALGVSALLEAGSRASGLKKALLFILPNLLIVLLSVGAVAKVDLNPGNLAPADMLWRMKTSLLRTATLYGNYVPDHVAYHAIFLVLAVICLAVLLYRRCKEGVSALSGNNARLLLISSLFILGFLLFYHGVIPVIWKPRNYLPRYLVQALPFMIILAVLGFRRVCSARCTVIALLVLLGFCLVNRKGVLYPVIPFNDISLAERSEEYLDGYVATRDCLAWLEMDVRGSLPVYFCSFTYPLTQNPSLGYVKKPLPQAINVTRSPQFGDLDLNSFPDQFIAVYNYPWWGGQELLSLIGKAQAPLSGWQKTLHMTFSQGMFHIHAVGFSREPGMSNPVFQQPS